jgi:glycosyltransferase involved in cell wall biosynthesis
LGVQDDTLLVGIVANFHPLKGHQYFIDAARTIRSQTRKKVRFVIAGRKLERRSSYWNHMMSLIKERGLETDMKVLGHCGDVPELLRALDIFVMPSISEPLGVVVLEAMACGKPIVATNAGGVPEMLTHGETGLLVAPRSGEAIAAAVLRLAEDSSLASALANNARARVAADFTPRHAAARYEELYEEAMR